MAVVQPTTCFLRGDKPKKVVIVGDPRCGKTTLWRILKKDTYASEQCNTTYLDVLLDNGQKVCLSLEEHDSDPYNPMRQQMYIESKAVIICFRLSQSETLANAEDIWYPEIREENEIIPVFLVGLKLFDDVEISPVLRGEAEEVAERIRAEKYVTFTSENVETSKTELMKAVAETVANRRGRQRYNIPEPTLSMKSAP